MKALIGECAENWHCRTLLVFISVNLAQTCKELRSFRAAIKRRGRGRDSGPKQKLLNCLMQKRDGAYLSVESVTNVHAFFTTVRLSALCYSRYVREVLPHNCEINVPNLLCNF